MTEPHEISVAPSSDVELLDKDQGSQDSLPILNSQDALRQSGSSILYLKWLNMTSALRSTRPYLRIKRFLSGPDHPEPCRLVPIRSEDAFERVLARSTYLTKRWRCVIIPAYLIIWLVAVAVVTKVSWFSSGAAAIVSTQASFWAQNDECGLAGINCKPFDNTTQSFRCPSNPVIRLLNPRAVGSQEINYQPLLVGGGDALRTYRADSWLCAAAMQQGLISNFWGGCASVNQIGSFADFLPWDANGVVSVGFNTSFPSAFRLTSVDGSTRCKDLKFPLLAMNVTLLFIFSLLLRPPATLFYWVSVCVGFWHLAVTQSPPDLSAAFGTFLPCLFICYAFWKIAYRFVLPRFQTLRCERSIVFGGFFWVGIMMDLTFDKIPISRLTAHDIRQQPGGLVAVIILAIALALIVINQFRVIRKTGWLVTYLAYYILAILVIVVLASLPGLQLRIYIAALFLIPLTAFETRLNLAYQGFLLGMFLNGAAIWGFASVLQTAAELRGDGAIGSDLPVWITNSNTFSPSANISWSSIPSNLTSNWNGFALRFATTFSIANLNATQSHYFRLAYQLNGVSGDFTQAAMLRGASWTEPADGPS